MYNVEVQKREELPLFLLSGPCKIEYLCLGSECNSEERRFSSPSLKSDRQYVATKALPRYEAFVCS